MKILEGLFLLKEQALSNNVYYTDIGICFNLNEMIGEDICAYAFVGNASEDWKHCSGVYGYPIELSDDCGLWEGKQLELRLSLIDHLITKAKLLEGV